MGLCHSEHDDDDEEEEEEEKEGEEEEQIEKEFLHLRCCLSRSQGKAACPANVSTSAVVLSITSGGSTQSNMPHLTVLLLLLSLTLPSTDASVFGGEPVFYGDDATGYGPVFEDQPVETIYPEESPEAKITMSCRARANPPATYQWRLNSWEIDLDGDNHYTMVGGNLVISNPIKNKHVGKYSCVASNDYGTVVSREAGVQFGYELSFRWILNEFPIFIMLDKRRFVDSSDSGNYSCFVSSASIAKSVFSKFIPLVPLAERPIRKYPADIKVKFPDTYALVGQNVTLECFALGNPIPQIRWRKMNGELPSNHDISMAGAHLHLYNVQYEDEGTYECEALNSKGKDRHKAHLSVEAFPEWTESINSTEKDISSDYTMSCYDKHDLKFNGLTFEDSGMYQCIAENRHGVIYANAELRVIACAPTFEHNPLKRRILGAKNGRVVIECKPKAAPKPSFSWSKGTELLFNSTRVLIWEDGGLEILNVTKADEGQATKITLAPSNADVMVGESARMQCAASHDATLDITFVWTLDTHAIDFDREGSHYERNPNGASSGELLIKNTQLKHSGRYTCTAQTPVDNVTASADLVVRGPPGSPGGVRVEEIRDKSVRLTWSRGTDNHSPISKYTVQCRDSFSQEDWRDATTSTNTLGTGDPSGPSPKVTTLEAVQPQYYYGRNFGYIIAFKPRDDDEWRKVTVADPEAKHYVHKDSSIPASTEFQARALSATEAIVWWLPVTQHTVEGYQVRYWRKAEDSETSSQRVVVSSRENQTRLDNMRPDSHYLIELKGTSVNIAWEHVEPLANESTIDGYKVLYRQAGKSTGMLFTTGKRSIDLPMHKDGDYVVEVRAHSEGGDGAVAQVRISGGGVMAAKSLSLASLLLVALFCLMGL
ncbi:unnamed protein product [Coregonus sp. 'balchen']|nr:unnamed protein product [Coregonus sp. 'balchen']